MDTPKILIVDDEPLTCKLISTMLKLQGYPSTSITDPAQVLETVETETPQLILMDYHLGSAHGLDILQSLKSSHHSQTIPVIMTSGMDYTQEAINRGAQGFLVKPFDWQSLSDAIQVVLNSDKE